MRINEKKIGVAKYQQPLNSFYVIIRSKAQLKIKCFSIISLNLNPDAQPLIPKFMFYHPAYLYCVCVCVNCYEQKNWLIPIAEKQHSAEVRFFE